MPGRGRGRTQRHLQYNRSSSSESLTKSVDLGHRSQWPSERMPQHSGTFPRSKANRNRNVASGSSKEAAEAAGADSGQEQGGSKYTFSSMRAPRERSGSISSDTSGGSDLSWEDLEAEFEKEKPDWNTQVEMYLEEVARQVQDSTQRLTDSIDNSFDMNPTPASLDQSAELTGPQTGLTRNLSASSDHIFTQEYRGRKKDRRRKGSRSKNSSRESSIHSNPHDEHQWPAAEGKRSHRRRNRRRHSSAGPGGRVGTVEGQRAAESLRIMVGKNREKRQVMVEGKGGGAAVEGRGDTGGEGGGGGEGTTGQQRARHHSGSYEQQHPHQQQQQQQQQRNKNHEHDRTPRDRRGEGGGGGGGRGGRRSQDHHPHHHQGQGHGDERRRYGGGGGPSGGDSLSRGRGHYQEGGRKPHGGQHQTHTHPSASGGEPPYYPRSARSPGAVPSDNMPSPTHPPHTAGLIKLPSEPPPPPPSSTTATSTSSSCAGPTPPPSPRARPRSRPRSLAGPGSRSGSRPGPGARLRA